MEPEIARILGQDAVEAARELLGVRLAVQHGDRICSGFIVETEAYRMDDPASHAYGGMRVRNAPLYEAAGTIYIYFTYGMHYCVNMVTGPAGKGQGVLIRAVEPAEGLDIMRANRPGMSDLQLTSGPAKLVQAMGIRPSLNGSRLRPGSLWLEPGRKPAALTQTTRVGISKAIDHPWRFYVTGNRWVSKPEVKAGKR